MTIGSLQKQFKQFFNAESLQKMAKSTGPMKRCRAILPDQLVISLVAVLSKENCSSIADLLRQFNGMCLSAKDTVAYKPYHNQLRKEEFPTFMRQLAMRAIAQFARQQSANLPDKLAIFDDVLLQAYMSGVHYSYYVQLPLNYRHEKGDDLAIIPFDEVF